MAYENDVYAKIKKDVNMGINERYGNEDVEKLLYLIPYESIAITASSNSREIPITLENVIVAVKEKKSIDEDKLIKLIELFDLDGTKIGESNDEGRMHYERAIEDKIFDQIRKIRSAGYQPAGVDDNNNLDSIIEVIGRQIVTINEEQKEKSDKSNDRVNTLKEMSKLNVTTKVDKSKEFKQNDKEDKKGLERLEEKLGIKVHKMTKIDSADVVFWENNPEIKTKDAYVVLTDNNEIRMVGENDGEFEELDCFTNPTNESGRTTIIYNDTDDLSDNTKNTYGSIMSKNNKGFSYTVEIDDYGEIGLVERRKSPSGGIEESDRWISRSVQTDNSKSYLLNLEGNTSKNITQESFRARSTSKNATISGKGGISEIAENMKNHPHNKDFTMEAFAADDSMRLAEAMRLINEELKARGIGLSNEEEEKLQDKLVSYIGNSEHIFCKDEAVQYVNEIQIERRNKDNPEKDDESDGRNRLDEAAENMANRRK